MIDRSFNLKMKGNLFPAQYFLDEAMIDVFRASLSFEDERNFVSSTAF